MTYTPTTDEMREWYVRRDRTGRSGRKEYELEFDRWLAQERAQAKAEALRVAAGDFAFTDQVWRDYQGLPDQGYSHRDYLEHVVNQWLRDYANKLERASND